MPFTQLRVISSASRKCLLCLALFLAAISEAFSQLPGTTPTPLPLPSPPQRGPAVPGPTAPPVAPFLAGPPDTGRIARATPLIQVWRDGSNVAQSPPDRDDQLDAIFVAGTEPVTIVLRFDPSLARKPLKVILGDDAITLQPQGETVNIGANGEVAFLALLGATRSDGTISFYIDGVATALHLQRVPLWALVQRENAIRGDRP